MWESATDEDEIGVNERNERIVSKNNRRNLGFRKDGDTFLQHHEYDLILNANKVFHFMLI